MIRSRSTSNASHDTPVRRSGPDARARTTWPIRLIGQLRLAATLAHHPGPLGRGHTTAGGLAATPARWQPPATRPRPTRPARPTPQPPRPLGMPSDLSTSHDGRDRTTQAIDPQRRDTPSGPITGTRGGPMLLAKPERNGPTSVVGTIIG